MHRTTIALALLLPLAALAQQAAIPVDFPADAVAPAADALRSKLAGHVFKVRTADGSNWRLEYKASGYAFLDTASGFRDTGTWRVEDGRLCAEWRKANGGCNDVRLLGEAIYLKRASNGEVIVLAPG